MPHLEIAELDENSERREKMEVDLTDEQIKGLKIGQKIVLTVKGSVGLLGIPPEGTSNDYPAWLGIRVDSKDLRATNVFEELAEDEEDD